MLSQIDQRDGEAAPVGVQPGPNRNGRAIAFVATRWRKRRNALGVLVHAAPLNFALEHRPQNFAEKHRQWFSGRFSLAGRLGVGCRVLS